MLPGTAGTVWFDALQLERGDAANPINLIENSNMENHFAWSGSSALVSGVDTYTTAQAHSYGESYRLHGDYVSYKHIVQWIPVRGKSTDTYVVSGWAKGASLSKVNNPDSRFCLAVTVVYTDGTKRDLDDIEFDRYVRDWQYVSKAFTVQHPDYPDKIAARLEIYCVYDFNGNDAYFDDVQLIKDVAPTYTYDDEGNLTSVKDLAEQKSEYEFSNNVLVRTLNPTGSSYINSYYWNDKNRLESSVADGVAYAYAYDAKGNVTRARAISSELKSGRYYYLITGNGNMVVDLYQNNTAAGTKFIAYTPRKTAGQKMKLVSASGGYYTIRPSTDESKVLGVRGAGASNNTAIELQTETGADSQLWYFKKNTDGSYQIYPKHATSMRLDSPKPGTSADNDLILFGNNNGQQQKFILEAVDSTDSAYMQSTATYSSSGAYPASVTTMDGTTSTTYDEGNDRLNSATGAYSKTEYTYTSNSLDYTITQKDKSTNTQLAQVGYQYTGEQLTQIVSPGATYDFSYDAYGNRLTTKVGGNTLMTNSYQNYNGLLEQSVYGNGNKVQYSYDHLNRLKQLAKWTGSTVKMYSWEYDVFGNISKLFDASNWLTTYYQYDSIGRINRFDRSDGYAGEVTYDAKNRYNSSIYLTTDGSRSMSVTYDAAINRVKTGETDGLTWSNTYDGLGRLTGRSYDIGAGYTMSESYDYRTSGNRTDARVAKHTFFYIPTEYEYDAAGNITKVTYPYNSNKTIEYEYDAMGRLKEERNQVTERMEIYTYNAQGNLATRKTYAYFLNTMMQWAQGDLLNTDGWSYTNDAWYDQCNWYLQNGITWQLSYDAIGNPLTYRNGMSMTWQNGRELKSIHKGNDRFGHTYWNYAYDVNGQRVSKTESQSATADGAQTTVHTTKYYYDGTKLAAEKKDDTIVWYDYDENGSPIGMRVNGQDYVFEKNLQGDIIRIYDENFSSVVKYTYDAWGKILSIDGTGASTIGEYNSLRYRGYYYDSDTGLYYLNSRYYDPVMCRFVNADAYNSTGLGIQGHNMYSYCLNNPIRYYDNGGCLPDDRLEENARLYTEEGWDFPLTIGTHDNNDTSNAVAIIDKNSPPDHPNFKPPKKGNRKVNNPNGPGKGWEDKNGNVWIPDNTMHGGEGWTVQYPNGGHEHAYPGGHIRKATAYSNKIGGTATMLVGTVVIIALLANDLTGVGIADDSLIPATAGCYVVGWDQIKTTYHCDVCDEWW